MRDVARGDVRVLAEAVADVLEERGLVALPQLTPGAVLSVSEVAKLLGRSGAWVYEHAAELGAFRFGTGPKARLGFDRDAIERWKRERQIVKPTRTSQARKRGRPRRTADSSAASLIPYDPSPRRA